MNARLRHAVGDVHFRLPIDDEALVDSAAAQKFLQVSRATIDRLVEGGQLRRVKLGKACRYSAGDLRGLSAPGGDA